MIDPQEFEKLVVSDTPQRRVPKRDFPPRKERRKCPRWDVFNQYVYLYHDTEYCVRIRDISLSGMSVENAPATLPVGAIVRIVTSLGRQGVLETLCEVVHIQEVAGFRYAGLQFTPRTDEELAPLAPYLDASE